MKKQMVVLVALLISGVAFADEAKVREAVDLLARQRSGAELTMDEQSVIDKASRDWGSVRDIRDRGRRGETLTQDEKKLIELAEVVRAKRAADSRAAYRAAHPPRASIGLVPLTDLGSGSYEGEEGGLYPGGHNVPPLKHLAAGLKLATSIVPLGSDGQPSGDGQIVVLARGMSNATQEFRAFQKLASEDAINPKVLLVDGAQGGQSADRTADPSEKYWKGVDRRLAEAGATREQIQVVWLKQAVPRPKDPFPAEASRFKHHLVANIHILRDLYPNLKVTYLSSRIYAGYAESPLNPEPHAYETAFSVKWLIADQINGVAEMNFDPASGPVRAPWMCWGPYLWADGTTARSDGLTYSREDLGVDGTHPSGRGRIKIGHQLLTFFKTDPTASSWFLPSK